MTDTAARQQFEAETILKLRNPSAHRLSAQLETLDCGQQASGIRDRQKISTLAYLTPPAPHRLHRRP
jgi:hypothetical protein